MKQILIFLSLQIFLNSLAGQNERHMKEFFKGISDKRKEKYFLKLPKSEQEHWYNQYFKAASLDTSSNRTVDDLKKEIYFIDLNNDKLPDIVDESSNGISPVLIYLNCKDSFKLLIEEQESRFKEITKKGGKTEIVTFMIGMVGEYRGESRYFLKNDSAVLIQKRLRQNCTEATKFYKKSKYATVKTDSTALREYAGVGGGECLLEGGYGEYNKNSNILMRLNLNTEVIIWGDAYYEKQKWFLIEVLVDKIEKEFRIGWVKQEDLEWNNALKK